MENPGLSSFYNQLETQIKLSIRISTVKPHIDREKMKSVTIKVGQSLEFDVPVIGEPPPEKVWTMNGQPVKDDGRITVSFLCI